MAIQINLHCSPFYPHNIPMMAVKLRENAWLNIIHQAFMAERGFQPGLLVLYSSHYITLGHLRTLEKLAEDLSMGLV